jgi:hypothetical protein
VIYGQVGHRLRDALREITDLDDIRQRDGQAQTQAETQRSHLRIVEAPRVESGRQEDDDEREDTGDESESPDLELQKDELWAATQ